MEPQASGRQRDRRSRAFPLLMISLALTAQLVLLLASSRAESFFIDEQQSPHTKEWNYSEQPRWREMHRDCSGRAQSPIDIQHRNVITSQHLRLHFYNYNQLARFRLSNAHHTVKMNPLGGAYESEAGPGQPAVGANTSSFHDILTADEYLEVTPTQQRAAASDNEHLSRLVLANVGQRQPAGSSDDERKRHREAPMQSKSHQALADSDIERERELDRGGANSVQVDVSRQQQLAGKRLPYEGAPTIKLDWLDDGNNEYKLRDIHFHWGERRDNGSEHAIDGRRAAMEMHLVHIKHGLDKSSIGFTSDSVAVIAVLIESHRKSNADFNPIVNELARINSTEQAQEVDYKSIYDLLPSNLQAFYTYSGSLTTPPCYQVVNWIVMAERLNMNAKQIEMFRNLYAPPGHEREREAAAPADPNDDHEHQAPQHRRPLELIMPNVRQIQTLNNRTILASFTKYGSRLDAVTTPISAATPAAALLVRTVGCWLLLATLASSLAALRRPLV